VPLPRRSTRVRRIAGTGYARPALVPRFRFLPIHSELVAIDETIERERKRWKTPTISRRQSPALDELWSVAGGESGLGLVGYRDRRYVVKSRASTHPYRPPASRDPRYFVYFRSGSRLLA